MLIKRTNPFTGKVNEMELDVTLEQLAAWESGVLIQKAMPNLSAGEREFLISGFSIEEQKEIFG